MNMQVYWKDTKQCILSEQIALFYMNNESILTINLKYSLVNEWAVSWAYIATSSMN